MDDTSYLEWTSGPLSTGTTTMACEFGGGGSSGGGVVIGADSRTTLGSYVSNRVTDKLCRLTERIYCCRSGSAADTQAVSDLVKFHLKLQQMESGEEPLVGTTANIFRQLCYSYRNQIVASIIVAGWDHKYGGQIYTVPMGGMAVRQPVSIGGSGSLFVYGYVDANFKQNMTKEEAVKFVIKTLALAMLRDASSGGVVRLGIITENGVERSLVQSDEFTPLFDEFF